MSLFKQLKTLSKSTNLTIASEYAIEPPLSKLIELTPNVAILKQLQLGYAFVIIKGTVHRPIKFNT